jgi:Phosphorylase superfamily
MDTPPEPVLFVAMRSEERAAHRAAPSLPVRRVGIALAEWLEHPVEVGISAGLAGGLRDDLPPGTVVVADRVATPLEPAVPCDPEWTGWLRAAADRLGLHCVSGPMITTPALVTDTERGRWAAEGYLAADMESGLLIRRVPRLAVARVILDTPKHEVSPKWATPWKAALDPRLVRETVWLARYAGAFARRAALVAAEAFGLSRTAALL